MPGQHEEDPFDDDFDVPQDLDLAPPVVKRHKKSLFDPEDEEPVEENAVEIKEEPPETSPEKSTSLSLFQKARAEKNRLKALTLRNSKLTSQKSSSKSKDESDDGRKKVNLNILGAPGNQGTILSKEKKIIDSGAGFFIEEDSDEEETPTELTELPAPIAEPDRPLCQECQKDLAESFLFRTFNLSVCDSCKETEKDGKHELITKTDAKNTFLLKDYDLDKREPTLKFIVRKNPHNSRWGDMKLYLRSQIEERALEVWGSEERLEQEHAKRDEKRETAKVKKFNKKLKALRMEVRGSLYKRDLGGHVHEFGEEICVDEEAGEYEKTCLTCNFKQKYEKM